MNFILCELYNKSQNNSKFLYHASNVNSDCTSGKRPKWTINFFAAFLSLWIVFFSPHFKDKAFQGIFLSAPASYKPWTFVPAFGGC